MNYLPILIRELQTLKADARANGAVFKIRAYDKVLKQLEAREEPIHAMADLAAMDGIGTGIKARFEVIFAEGYLPEAQEIQQAPPNPKQILQCVYGIGPKKAATLVESGITSLEGLRAAYAKNKKLLNDKQAIGLRYAEDLTERIPKVEMDRHNALLLSVCAEVAPTAEASLVGSYRRKKDTSGDIDMLVTSKDLEAKGGVPYLLQEIQKRAPGYILETLAEGPHKFMGICKLGATKARRLDILLTSPEEYPYALLYFTGSDKFNIKMRKHALKQKYSLNEHGLTPPPATPLKTEREIFMFLKFPYVEPQDRDENSM